MSETLKQTRDAAGSAATFSRTSFERSAPAPSADPSPGADAARNRQRKGWIVLFAMLF